MRADSFERVQFAGDIADGIGDSRCLGFHDGSGREREQRPTFTKGILIRHHCHPRAVRLIRVLLVFAGLLCLGFLRRVLGTIGWDGLDRADALARNGAYFFDRSNRFGSALFHCVTLPVKEAVYAQLSACPMPAGDPGCVRALFGGKKIAEVAKGLGEGIRNFKILL